MLSSLRALAVAVDGLSAHGVATLTETPSALTIAALGAAEVAQLSPLLTALGWSFETVDGAGERADIDALTEDCAPFIVTVEKPSQAAALQVVTMAGLEAFLLQEREDVVWEVATLATPFATMAADFLPWGSTGIFSPAPTTKSPRQLVRDHNAPPRAPGDIRVWMPRVPASEQLWGDPVSNVRQLICASIDESSSRGDQERRRSRIQGAASYSASCASSRGGKGTKTRWLQ